jgi:hypothetical protein
VLGVPILTGPHSFNAEDIARAADRPAGAADAVVTRPCGRFARCGSTTASLLDANRGACAPRRARAGIDGRSQPRALDRPLRADRTRSCSAAVSRDDCRRGPDAGRGSGVGAVSVSQPLMLARASWRSRIAGRLLQRRTFSM